MSIHGTYTITYAHFLLGCCFFLTDHVASSCRYVFQVATDSPLCLQSSEHEVIVLNVVRLFNVLFYSGCNLCCVLEDFLQTEIIIKTFIVSFHIFIFKISDSPTWNLFGKVGSLTQTLLPRPAVQTPLIKSPVLPLL